MEELTDDQKVEILDKIRKASEERAKIPESERKYAPRPERYNFLIGIDPEGNPYPVRDKKRNVPKPEKTEPDRSGSVE